VGPEADAILMGEGDMRHCSVLDIDYMCWMVQLEKEHREKAKR